MSRPRHSSLIHPCRPCMASLEVLLAQVDFDALPALDWPCTSCPPEPAPGASARWRENTSGYTRHCPRPAVHPVNRVGNRAGAHDDPVCPHLPPTMPAAEALEGFDQLFLGCPTNQPGVRSHFASLLPGSPRPLVAAGAGDGVSQKVVAAWSSTVNPFATTASTVGRLPGIKCDLACGHSLIEDTPHIRQRR